VTEHEEQFSRSAANDADEAPDDVVDTERLIREAQEQARTYLANWQRAQADLENYKRRAQIERRDAMDIANSSLLARLLGAMDDMERTFSRPASEMRKAAWAEGARLSFQKLKAALAAEGVEQIEATGKPFDPRFHEAVMRRAGPDGIVLEDIQKGYMMHGRVLRPAMVVVGEQEEPTSEETESVEQ